MTFEQREKIDNWQLHPSIRGQFGFEMYKLMAENKNVWLLTADLGYKLWDEHIKDFPDRAIVMGASEQCLIGAAAGIALTNPSNIVFAYSITSFLLYRGFEWVRNYLNHERIPVRLVGSGLLDDYKHDGITHHTFDAKAVLALFPNIKTWFPNDKREIAEVLRAMIRSDSPSFVCLRR